MEVWPILGHRGMGRKWLAGQPAADRGMAGKLVVMERGRMEIHREAMGCEAGNKEQWAEAIGDEHWSHEVWEANGGK